MDQLNSLLDEVDEEQSGRIPDNDGNIWRYCCVLSSLRGRRDRRQFEREAKRKMSLLRACRNRFHSLPFNYCISTNIVYGVYCSDKESYGGIPGDLVRREDRQRCGFCLENCACVRHTQLTRRLLDLPMESYHR
jgi:hypothetical protein